MSYSQDFRNKVLSVKADKKLSIKATAKHFCIGEMTIKYWLKDPVLKTTKNRPHIK